MWEFESDTEDVVPAPLDAIEAVFTEQIERNEEFFRPDSHLHIMILTNAADRSTIADERFRRVLDGAVDDELALSVRVRAVVPNIGQLVPDWGVFTSAFDGTTYGMGSWDRGIRAVYQHGINQRREFPLTEFPAEAPREVIVTYRERNTVLELDEDYEYSSTLNAIRFPFFPPEPNSTIRVRYEPAN